MCLIGARLGGNLLKIKIIDGQTPDLQLMVL